MRDEQKTNQCNQQNLNRALFNKVRNTSTENYISNNKNRSECFFGKVIKPLIKYIKRIYGCSQWTTLWLPRYKNCNSCFNIQAQTSTIFFWGFCTSCTWMLHTETISPTVWRSIADILLKYLAFRYYSPLKPELLVLGVYRIKVSRNLSWFIMACFFGRIYSWLPLLSPLGSSFRQLSTTIVI